MKAIITPKVGNGAIFVPGKGVVNFNPEGFIETDDRKFVELLIKTRLDRYIIEVDGEIMNPDLRKPGPVELPPEDEPTSDKEIAEITEDDVASSEEMGDPEDWEWEHILAYVKQHDLKTDGRKKPDLVKAIREHLAE